MAGEVGNQLGSRRPIALWLSRTIGDADDDREHVVECGHLAFIKPAEVRAAFFPWHGDDLVDHDLSRRR